MNPTRANIAVCGRFHYSNYVQYLHEAGGLNRFYYSSRLSVNAESLGLPSKKNVNLFAKEYLGALHWRLLGNRWLIEGRSFYHDLWQMGVLMRWSPAPVLHLMLHGNGRKLIQRARRDNAIIIGEPVNSHPQDLRQLINEEHRRLGLSQRETDNVIDRRLETEAQQCDYLLAGSNVVKNSYARHGFPEERIHVLPYGTDTQRFRPLSAEERAHPPAELTESRFRVICVGQIIPRKGHIYLLEAWKKLNLPNAELLFIGTFHPIMRSILAPYEGIFRHIPYVAHSQLRHYYGASHVFVLPSIEDGFAYVCTEAMACGLPVITTENTGAGEILHDEADGFVVPVRSAEKIAEKLELLYSNEIKRREMGAAALDKVERDFSWSGYAARLLTLHNDVVRKEQP